EPNLITEEVIDFCVESKAFLPHFHIPLQAGTDKILRLMKRKYERELFAQRVNYINKVMPRAFIAADVIVGFPGETEEDFEDTKAFIEQLPLAALHVFTYSERPGTPAASMQGSVPISERHRRSEELQKISDQKKQEFYLNNKGCELNVLWESDEEDGMMFGWTDNYIRVGRKYDKLYVNTITKEKIEILDNKYKAYII
ncbi:MAG: radical SAM protein, partial [Bacteroidales bacterium]|nr:radical SAM protein [Bacteroidales bacterium]